MPFLFDPLTGGGFSEEDEGGGGTLSAVLGILQLLRRQQEFNTILPSQPLLEELLELEQKGWREVEASGRVNETHKTRSLSQ